MLRFRQGSVAPCFGNKVVPRMRGFVFVGKGGVERELKPNR
jgi:hypothetical protein